MAVMWLRADTPERRTGRLRWGYAVTVGALVLCLGVLVQPLSTPTGALVALLVAALALAGAGFLLAWSNRPMEDDWTW